MFFMLIARKYLMSKTVSFQFNFTQTVPGIPPSARIGGHSGNVFPPRISSVSTSHFFIIFVRFCHVNLIPSSVIASIIDLIRCSVLSQ